MMNAESSEALTVVPDPNYLRIPREPDVVLREATKAAQALKQVLDSKPKKVMFNGEQYLEFEDWQMVGSFYGITAKVVSVEYVEYGVVKGFSARAVVLRPDGAEISAAEADCLSDEPKWSTRAKFEWQDGAKGRERVKVGDEPVPLFQLKSMAQTRACAKALRNVLARVVVLAGYRPTPSEELDTEAIPQGIKNVTNKPKATDIPSHVQSERVAATPAAPVMVTSVEFDSKGVNVKSGDPWTKYTIGLSDGRRGSCFDEAVSEAAERCKVQHLPVIPVFEKKGKYVNLVALDVLTPTPTAAPARQAAQTVEPFYGKLPPSPVETVKTPSYRVTRVVELSADGELPKVWGFETQELGPEEWIRTREIDLARAGFRAKRDQARVELVFTMEAGERWLVSLSSVRSVLVREQMEPDLLEGTLT